MPPGSYTDSSRTDLVEFSRADFIPGTWQEIRQLINNGDMTAIQDFIRTPLFIFLRISYSIVENRVLYVSDNERPVFHTFRDYGTKTFVHFVRFALRP